MSDLRLGRIARALRHRLAWRQSDVAARAGVSQDLVSRIERGQVDTIPVRKIRGVVAAVGGELELHVRWRGGQLDRLLDEGHAALVGMTANLLVRAGWQVEVEVSFAVFGERGSIDLLAWHPATGILLVVEVKTEIASVEETLRRHDVKVRLAGQVARERSGRVARSSTRLLVVADTSTSRRRIARHEAIFARPYPARGETLRRWLRDPGPLAGGLIFLSPAHGVRGMRSPAAQRRIRRARPRSARPPSGVPGPSPGDSTHQVRSWHEWTNACRTA